MSNTSGIIFKDLFVNNKSLFIEYFQEMYREKSIDIDFSVNQLIQTITSLQNHITDKTAVSFQKAWTEFQAKVLLNTQPLQLIVGYRSGQKGGLNVEMSMIMNQNTVESGNMIQTGNEIVKDAVAAAKAREIEQVLQHHVNSFLNTLYYDHLNKERTQILLSENKKQWLPQGRDFYDIYRKNWVDIYYGNSTSFYSGKGLGQAYDAYMNHMANHHRQLYDYLSTAGQNNLAVPSLISSTVYQEEGGAEGDFPKLLKESLNHYSWYSGGDIIIVNPSTMTVVYNIQLKTTSGQTPGDFTLKLTKLLKFLYDFQAEQDCVKKAERLYKEFETKLSNTKDFDNSLDKTVDEILRQGLGSAVTV